MKIRLNKVQKELNVGLSTIVEFLQKNNFEIEENPNAVVPEEGMGCQYSFRILCPAAL